MIKYKNCPKGSLDLDIGIYINDDEITHISSIVKALDPIKLAVEALFRRDANCTTAEATIKFILEEIQNYSTSGMWKKISIILHAIQVQKSYLKLVSTELIFTKTHNSVRIPKFLLKPCLLVARRF